MEQQSSILEHKVQRAQHLFKAGAVALIIVGVTAIFFPEHVFRRNPVRYASTYLFAINACALVCIGSLYRIKKLTNNT